MVEGAGGQHCQRDAVPACRHGRLLDGAVAAGDGEHRALARRRVDGGGEVLAGDQFDDAHARQRTAQVGQEAAGATRSGPRVDHEDDPRPLRVRRTGVDRQGVVDIIDPFDGDDARRQPRESLSQREPGGDVGRVVGSRRDAGEAHQRRERAQRHGEGGPFGRCGRGERHGTGGVPAGERGRRGDPARQALHGDRRDRRAGAAVQPLGDLVGHETRDADRREAAGGGTPPARATRQRQHPGDRHPQHRAIGRARQRGHGRVEQRAVGVRDRTEGREVEGVDVATHTAPAACRAGVASRAGHGPEITASRRRCSCT